VTTISQETTAPAHFTETFLPGGVHTALYLRSAVVEQNVKADVLLTHGLGEHSARYDHVALVLAQNGYRLCTYDLRGHGRSQGRRGHIHRYADLLDDLERVMNYHMREGIPMFLYGHSLGGQITLNYLLRRRQPVCGAIIASPWLELVYRPLWLKVLLAKIMVGIWPTFTQNRLDNPAVLSRDQAFLASLPGKDLIHHKVSARMYRELLEGARRASEGAPEWDYPLLLIHGADDPVTSPAATESFFQKAASPDKTLKIHPAMRHETHNEIGRETVFAEMVEWMDKRLPAKLGGG
jgi:alpha-beta hydrolase superfamily lysophospholipase